MSRPFSGGQELPRDLLQLGPLQDQTNGLAVFIIAGEQIRT
jgi:hypothetical protein